MSSFKLIALDIGGTLLSDDNTVSSENVKSLKLAKEKSIKISLMTAREYSSTKYISNLIDCDYGVFSNGNHVFDLKNMKSLKLTYIANDAVREIYEFCKQKNLYFHINLEYEEISDELDYFCLKHILLNKNYPEHLKSNCHVVKELVDYIKNRNVAKIVIVSEENMNGCLKEIAPILKKYNLFITENNSNLYESILDKTINYIEIGACNDNKSTGLRYLMNELEIDENNVYVFGDGVNDYEVLSDFPNSICMCNGDDSVKNIARYVTTRDNNSSGVAEMVKKIVRGDI